MENMVRYFKRYREYCDGKDMRSKYKELKVLSFHLVPASVFKNIVNLFTIIIGKREVIFNLFYLFFVNILWQFHASK